jgi:hypothetical protein
MGPQETLQRGRKCLLLVTILRTNVLHAVPEVSVRRLDLVSLEELKKLAAGSVETVSLRCAPSVPFHHTGLGGRHEGAKHIIEQALSSTPGTRVRLEPLDHRTSRRNDI